MKKEISMAVMATILFLQLAASLFDGLFGEVANILSEKLAVRVHVEEILQGGRDGSSN